MNRIVVTGAGAAFLTMPLAARAADFTGAWLIQQTIGAQPPSAVVCVLKADKAVLYGPCAARVEHSRAATGWLDASSMTFRYRTDYNGSGVHLVYRGDVQPDGSVKGNVTSEGGKGVFQATPLTDTKSGAPVTWKVSAAFSDTLRYVLLCTFKADGRSIAGPCTVVGGPTLKTEGTASGNTVTLHYDAPARVDYTGVLQPDGTLAGTVASAGATGRFTGEKQ